MRTLYDLSQDPSTIKINVVFCATGALRFEGHYVAYMRSNTPGEITPAKGTTEKEAVAGITAQLKLLGAIVGRQYMLSRDIEVSHCR